MAVPGNWMLFFDWNCTGAYGSTSMTIAADGTWSNGEGYTGTWSQSAGMLTFQFDNSKTTYSGNLASLSVTGIQSTFIGLAGCFYLLEAGAPTVLAERAAGAPDSSGAS